MFALHVHQRLKLFRYLSAVFEVCNSYLLVSLNSGSSSHSNINGIGRAVTGRFKVGVMKRISSAARHIRGGNDITVGFSVGLFCELIFTGNAPVAYYIACMVGRISNSRWH
jgi:hypothetical protein